MSETAEHERIVYRLTIHAESVEQVEAELKWQLEGLREDAYVVGDWAVERGPVKTVSTLSTIRPLPPRRPRLKACVENWPDCYEGGYDPACCRFPKSCSCDVYRDEYVTADDLEEV